MIKIYVDKNKIEYNDKKAYHALSAMEQTGEYQIIYGLDYNSDYVIATCDILATNVKEHAVAMAEIFPDKDVFLIEHPLNKGYKSQISNLHVVWCWDDFQFFVYFPKKD